MSRDAHPARVFSHCPRCGKSPFPFDGRNAFNCPACSFRFYINEAASTAAIIERPASGSARGLSHGAGPGSEILMIRRGRDPGAGTLDLPGGFVDIGETAEQAVRREVLEELGVELAEARFMATFPNEYEYRGVLYFTLDIAFICRIKDEAALTTSEEARELLWMRARDVDADAIGFPSIRNAVRRYAEMHA